MRKKGEGKAAPYYFDDMNKKSTMLRRCYSQSKCSVCKSLRFLEQSLIVIGLLSTAGHSMTTSMSASQDTLRITLAIGDSFSIANTTAVLNFQDVLEDSRCPRDVDCIRAGDAIVRIRIDDARATSVTYILHTDESLGRTAIYHRLHVELIELIPLPSADKRPEPENYRLTLLLRQV